MLIKKQSKGLCVRVLPLLALLTICLSSSQGYCGEAFRPEGMYAESDAQDRKNGSDINIGLWLVSIFREHISAVDSDRCPSVPSCSSYSVTAFKKHGFLMGWLMTVDRLIHEADEASVSMLVYDSDGRVKIFDPVENNEFWWSCLDEKTEE
jgi:hypothetical protein